MASNRLYFPSNKESSECSLGRFPSEMAFVMNRLHVSRQCICSESLFSDEVSLH